MISQAWLQWAYPHKTHERNAKYSNWIEYNMRDIEGKYQVDLMHAKCITISYLYLIQLHGVFLFLVVVVVVVAATFRSFFFLEK